MVLSRKKNCYFGGAELGGTGVTGKSGRIYSQQTKIFMSKIIVPLFVSLLSRTEYTKAPKTKKKYIHLAGDRNTRILAFCYLESIKVPEVFVLEKGNMWPPRWLKF